LADKSSDPIAKMKPSMLAKARSWVRRCYKVRGESVEWELIIRIMEIVLRMRREHEGEVAELGRWWLPPVTAQQSKADKEWVAKKLLERGGSVTEAAERAEMFCRHVGRPVTKRHLALQAFDMWLQNPHKSWMQVTREVCNCGKPSHDLRCKDQLLQQVKDLKNFLKKYEIPIPSRCPSTKPK